MSPSWSPVRNVGVPPPKKIQKAEPVATEGNVFFANVVNEQETQQSVTSRSSSKKAVSDDDWSNLSFTALKRKPITEIMSYLKAKGASITGDDGKPLKKAELLKTIFSAAG